MLHILHFKSSLGNIAWDLNPKEREERDSKVSTSVFCIMMGAVHYTNSWRKGKKVATLR